MVFPIGAALLAGLKAAGIGAASTLGSMGAGALLGGGRQQQSQMLPMSTMNNNMSGDNNPFNLQGLSRSLTGMGGMNGLSMPGLGMNFAGGLMDYISKYRQRKSINDKTSFTPASSANNMRW